MKALLVAVLGVTLAGCASAATGTRLPAPVNAAPAPVTESDDAERAAASLEAARAAISQAAATPAPPASNDEEPLGYTPEALHEARILLAREALVEANAAKQRVDIEEQLQRELEQLMERDRTAKSRRHHARAHR